jgi:hypothetical protein
MRALLIALLAGGVAWSAHASDAMVLNDSARSTILVAHDGRIEAYDRDGTRRLWSVAGPAHPTSMVASSDGATIALFDALNDRVMLVAASDGRATDLSVGATPMEGVYIGSDLYVLERDASRLERIGEDRSRRRIDLGADPAFLRRSGRSLYVYSRSRGAVEEIDTGSDRMVRSVETGPAASDMEVDGSYAYLVYPQRGKIALIDLRAMRAAGEIAVGAVPTDLALVHGTAITAIRLAVADPAAKRVWQVEGTESMTRAVARGFLRGLIGVGLYAGRNDVYPTGVDRVVVSGTQVLAYDSSSRTLYREVKGKPIAVASGVGPSSFAVTAHGIAVWENGALQWKVR